MMMIMMMSLQLDILIAIQHNHGVHPSSLDDVRDMFADLLADFHCLDKDVFTLDPSGKFFS
jgi:hypothetical protein